MNVLFFQNSREKGIEILEYNEKIGFAYVHEGHFTYLSSLPYEMSTSIIQYAVNNRCNVMSDDDTFYRKSLWYYIDWLGAYPDWLKYNTDFIKSKFLKINLYNYLYERPEDMFKILIEVLNNSVKLA